MTSAVMRSAAVSDRSASLGVISIWFTPGLIYVLRTGVWLTGKIFIDYRRFGPRQHIKDGTNLRVPNTFRFEHVHHFVDITESTHVSYLAQGRLKGQDGLLFCQKSPM